MASTLEDRKAKLLERGVASSHVPPFGVPDDCIFEPPCHVGGIGIDRALRLGAFSYTTTGYFYRCEIGRYCSIEENVQIGRQGHPIDWGSTSPTLCGDYRDVLNFEDPRAEGWRLGSPGIAPEAAARPASRDTNLIGNDVAIGYGALIMPGIAIGDGAVVRPMAVVTRDVPAYAVVEGSPATVRAMRFPEPLVARFQALRWWRYAIWDLDRAASADPERFLDHVEARAAAGMEEYRPQPVRVIDL